MTDPASVTVVGRGASTVVPDRLRVQLGVEALDEYAAGSLDACGRSIESMRAAMLGEGIDAALLQTTRATLYPDWQHGGRPRLIGYVARTGLTVTLLQPERLGAVLTAAVAAGGDAARVYGLEWTIADPAQAEAAARDTAFADARRRAEQYAAFVSRSLGDVVKISEAWDGPARPVRYAMAASSGVEADPGTVDVIAWVTVTWELS